jgi:steroid delta-isomerase-like uncharacterized protein
VSSDQNKAVVRRVFEEIVNKQNLAAIDDLLSPDIVIHTPVPGVGSGIESFRQFIGMFLSAFPQQHTELHDLIAEGDRVAVRHTHRGTHGGEFMGMPPTGRQFAVDGIEVFRIADGKVAEFWHMDDFLGLLQQLGAVPAPGAPAG